MSDLLRESPPLAPEDQRLVEVYDQIGRSSDDLPFSPDFEWMVETLRSSGDKRTEREILQRLFRLRKAGRLPRALRPSAPIGTIPAEDIDLVEGLLRRHLGTFGSRDQLPYSPEFEKLREEYNAAASRPLNPHQFWRLVARVSK